jgi:predicted aspartyl protease
MKNRPQGVAQAAGAHLARPGRHQTIPWVMPGLTVIAAILAGCVEVPSRAIQERLRAGWEHPRAYSGADEATVRLTRAKDNKLYCPLKINGRQITVALDTGSRSVFDLKMMRAFGVAVYRTHESYYGFGGYLNVQAGFVDEIDLGGLKIEGLSVIILDLTDLKRSQQMGSLPAIGGLVGADLLAAMSARIDYAALTLTLTKPRLAQ